MSIRTVFPAVPAGEPSSANRDSAALPRPILERQPQQPTADEVADRALHALHTQQLPRAAEAVELVEALLPNDGADRRHVSTAASACAAFGPVQARIAGLPVPGSVDCCLAALVRLGDILRAIDCLLKAGCDPAPIRWEAWAALATARQQLDYWRAHAEDAHA